MDGVKKEEGRRKKNAEQNVPHSKLRHFETPFPLAQIIQKRAIL
jgi:hypothetical protein